MTTSLNCHVRSIDADLTATEARCTGDKPGGESVAFDMPTTRIAMIEVGILWSNSVLYLGWQSNRV